MKQKLYVFHIGIEGSKPGIWRKLRAPGNFTLENLHTAIQIAFGWTNSHLHSFTINGTEYMMDEEPGMDMYEEGTRYDSDYLLDDLGLSEKQSFLYLYDFGDSWEHTITVSAVMPFTEEEAAPLCLEGKNAGPLEDSGGVWGYAEILDILKDPQHKSYEETREWAGDVDPLAFDIEDVNRILKKTFKPATSETETAKPALTRAPKKSAPKKTSKIAGKKAGKTGRKEIPDGKLKKLYALMGRVKELKPWEKLWDIDRLYLEFPGQEEPVLCSVLGREKRSFGIIVYPGFASMLSLFRMLDSETDNPFVFLGYQNCLACHMGQRNELFPDEREHLKKLGISFRGKQDWVYFRKTAPGHSPWYIDSKDADVLIKVLARFIDAYTAFEGGMKVDFKNDEILYHRYSEEEGKWITEAGKMPPIPMTVEQFGVKDGDVEPLKFVKQTTMVAEAETLYLPQGIKTNDGGAPALMRILILVDNKTGIILDQRFLDIDDDENNRMIDMLFYYMKDHGRVKTLMVRDTFATWPLKDFCEKIGVHLVHSKGMPAIDRFSKDLASLPR
jgi:hypothetical protein